MRLDILKNIDLFPQTIELFVVYGIGVTDEDLRKRVGVVKGDFVKFSKHYVGWVGEKLTGSILDDCDVSALDEIRRSFLDSVGGDVSGLEKKIMLNFNALCEFVRLNKVDLLEDCSERNIEELVNSINIVKYDLNY